MTGNERWDRILAVMARDGRVHSASLASAFDVSEMTVRRDLKAMSDAGLVHRVHGGAIPVGTAAGGIVRIGMIVPSDRYYFPEIIRGAENAALHRGGLLRVVSSNQSTRTQLQQISDLLEEGIDALVIAPTQHVAGESETYRALRRAGVPVTLIERFIDEVDEQRELDIVRSDHAHGATTALKHLSELGHHRVGLVLRNSPTASRLREGYLRALRRFSFHDDPAVHMLSVADDGGVVAERLDRIAGDLIEHGVTAALVLPDGDAATLADRLRERGVRVPDDFSIVAYDDETAARAHVPLTAVAPQKFELGRLAVGCCLDRIDAAREGRTITARHTTVFPELRVRASTAAPA